MKYIALFSPIDIKVVEYDETEDYEDSPFISFTIGPVEANSLSEGEDKLKELLKQRFIKIGGL